MSAENNVDKLNIKKKPVPARSAEKPLLLAAGISIEPGSALGKRTAQPL